MTGQCMDKDKGRVSEPDSNFEFCPNWLSPHPLLISFQIQSNKVSEVDLKINVWITGETRSKVIKGQIQDGRP